LARPAEAAAGPPLWRGLLLLGALVAAGFAAHALGGGSLGGAALAGAPPTVRGALVLVGAGGLLAAVGLPRQAVAFAGGLAFGAWRGGALALAAQMLGCALDYGWARALARDWAVRLLRGRLARAERFLAARPFAATLTLRLLPVGNNLLLNLAAGVCGLRAAPFLAASLLGYLPQTAIFALAGSGTQVDRRLQLVVGAALFAASAALGTVLLRRSRGQALGAAPGHEALGAASGHEAPR
jgi:uncharacterized membrane protein YdjX (TVP38/TMEM64 family)